MTGLILKEVKGVTQVTWFDITGQIMKGVKYLISLLPLKHSKLFQESLIRPDCPTSLDIVQSLKTL